MAGVATALGAALTGRPALRLEELTAARERSVLLVGHHIFAIPGVGRYFIAAAGAGDYPLTIGLTAALTIAIVIANTLSDVAHAALDPRIRDA